MLIHDLSFLNEDEQQAIKDLELQLVDVVTDLLVRLDAEGRIVKRTKKIYTMILFGIINFTYTWYDPKGAIGPQEFADMAVELGKAQLLALHLGRLKDDGRIRPEQVSVGKLNNVREAIKIARQCRTLLGANGITLEYPVLRHANNLESVLTYEGTSEVHQLTIGKALTGASAFR